MPDRNNTERNVLSATSLNVIKDICFFNFFLLSVCQVFAISDTAVYEKRKYFGQQVKNDGAGSFICSETFT
jgi:hypothetical protein